MKITLRKASAVQLLINEFVNSAQLSTSVSIGRYDDPTTVVKDASTKFKAVLAQKLSLTRVLYSLRKKVSTAGQAAGIPDVLADIAFMDKYVAILKPLTNVTKFLPSDEVIMSQQADLKTEALVPNRYSQREGFDVSIILPDFVSGYTEDLASLRKQKQNLSDKLLELNIKNEIELDEYETKVLTSYGLA